MAYQNFYATRLTNPINAVENTIKVDKAPSVTEGWLVLEARSPLNREIIRFTGVDVTPDGNFLTGVARGQQDTTAKSHEAFASVEMNITKADLDDALSVNSKIPVAITDIFGDSSAKTSFAAVKGLVWSQGTGRLASMSQGIVYINGNRTEVGAITNNNFPASKDTYVDVNASGAIVYTPVNNGAAAPAQVGDTVRIARISTDASVITSIVDIRQRPMDFEFNDANDSKVKSILNLVYPIGSIYTSVNSANPGAALGGTWVLEEESVERSLIASKVIHWSTGDVQTTTAKQNKLGSYGYIMLDTMLLQGDGSNLPIPAGYHVEYKMQAEVSTSNASGVRLFLNNIYTNYAGTWSGDTFRQTVTTSYFKASDIVLENTVGYSSPGINFGWQANGTNGVARVYLPVLSAYMARDTPIYKWRRTA